MLLLGDEAVALGAVHAGISAAYAYPGTPSTEILETLIHHSNENKGAIVASWSTNEKTAYEQALGTSIAGRRALVAMKHVGLNVAADPFLSSALVTIHGGLVIVVADDPGMHSSQNEQDSRYYADFARVLCLEPASPQEAYDMTREAFELSERFHMPVLLRLVTRLSHGKGVVLPRAARSQNPVQKAPSPAPWTLLPSHSRKLWKERIFQQPELTAYSSGAPVNRLNVSNEARLGVITTGFARNYFLEASEELSQGVSHLHIGTYPFPEDKVRALASKVQTLLVLEEGYPFVERFIRGVLPGAGSLEIHGKISGHVPPDGELTPDIVRKSLGLPVRTGQSSAGFDLPGRPPQLCSGCPHTDSFGALQEVLKEFGASLVTSDIGCYALGAMPQYKAIESCVCMGASIGMAKGAVDAGLHPVVAVLGDSTFLHSGMTGLLDAIAANTNMTLMILDNQTVAMTGGQPTITPSGRLKEIVLGLGVPSEHLHVLTAHRKFHETNAAIIRKELDYRGLSVIIAVRECVETAKRKKTEGSGEQAT